MIIGIDVGGTNVRIGSVGRACSLQGPCEVVSSKHFCMADHPIEEFGNIILKYIKKHEISKVDAISIGVPATVKTEFSTDGIKCVSIGRIEPYQKGLDLLIKACSLIKDELYKTNCIITICGPDREGKLEILKEMVAEKNLQEIVLFHDAVYGKEKEKMLLGSDVFVMPSRFEGHPMALIEALSYGLPVVATTGSNMRKDIDEYKAGWTADCNAKSIAYALMKMIKKFQSIKKYSKSSIELSKQYSWKLIAKLQKEKLHSILNRDKEK